MKKYGILSLNIYEKDNNWGSILQSYALQEAIIMEGCDEAYIVDVLPDCINRYEAKYPIVRCLPFHPFRLKSSFRNSVLNAGTYIRRDQKFRRFIESYYKKTKSVSVNELAKMNFAGYIVGSDIVWDRKFTKGFNDLYFCNYPFMKGNNIAYAPSMDDDPYNENDERIFRSRLSNFNYLSVRESSKQAYVESFTTKTVQAVLDPTLLLTAADYSKFLLDDVIKQPYVLVYTVHSDENLAQYVANYARENGLKIVRIELMDIKKKEYECINYNDASIEEWLTLIKNAELIVTNSFHACIFSILFEKQFHAISRYHGRTKIQDLCNNLGISNYYEKKDRYSFDLDKQVDYKLVQKKIEPLREGSKKYLIQAMKGE